MKLKVNSKIRIKSVKDVTTRQYLAGDTIDSDIIHEKLLVKLLRSGKVSESKSMPKASNKKMPKAKNKGAKK